MNTVNKTNDALTSLGIFNTRWEPENSIKGGIILIHGLGEYSGRYSQDFGKYFTDRGYEIITFDLPGHGNSTGKRGHIPSYEILIDIISAAVGDFRERYSSLPVFLYGHSLGGLIALDYAFQKGSDIDGIICSAPVLDVHDPIHPVKKFLAKALKDLLPSFAMTNGLNFDMLSKDKDVVDAYKNDPLVHPMTSSTLGMYIIEKGEEIRSHPEKLNTRSLIMVGSNEGIVSKDKIIKFCSDCNPAELQVWEGLFHELHNEPEKKAVFEFVEKWMNKQ